MNLVHISPGWAVVIHYDPKKNFDKKSGEHFHFTACVSGFYIRHPTIFKTKKAAREWVKLHYGYIAARRDLREYPHGWRMPLVVPVLNAVVTTETKYVRNVAGRNAGSTTSQRNGGQARVAVHSSAGRHRKGKGKTRGRAKAPR